MIKHIELDDITENPHQPRLDSGDVEGLADAILDNGLRQYPVGRVDGDTVELAAGHRRVEAVRLLNIDDTVTEGDIEDAGLQPGRVPVDVRDLADHEMLNILTIENARREGLSAIEEARLIRSHSDAGRTGAQIASVFGKSESWVSNRKRLLALPQWVQVYLHEGAISARQAQALIPAFRLKAENPDIVDHLSGGPKPGSLVDAAIDGMTSDEIRQRVDELESAVEAVQSGRDESDVRVQNSGGEAEASEAADTPAEGDGLPDANDDLGIGEPADAGDVARKNEAGEGWDENGEADDAAADETSEEGVTDKSRLAAALFNLVLEIESEMDSLPESVSTELQSARYTYRQVTGQSIIASLPGDGDGIELDDSTQPLDTDRVDAILDDPSTATEDDLGETFCAYRIADERGFYGLTKEIAQRARNLFGVVQGTDLDDDVLQAIDEVVEKRAGEVPA